MKDTKHYWKQLMKTKINGKTFHLHVCEDLILLRWQYSTNRTRDSVEFQANSQLPVFAETDKPRLKFIWKCKEATRAKTILRKKFKDGVFTLPNFKNYYKATIMNTVWCCHKK